MEFDVSHIVTQVTDFMGEEVTVSGVIFTHWNPERDDDAGVFDDFYLAPDGSSWEDKSNCIFLRHESLEDVMRRRQIRGKAGGVNQGGLSNPCKVTGTVQKSSDSLFRVELANLRLLEVVIDEFGKRASTVTVKLD